MTASQVAARLRAQIEAGEYRPGHQLPSKNVLAHELGVATPTVQQGFNELTSEGLVTSRRGAGIFVRTPPTTAPLDNVTRGFGVLETVDDVAPRWVLDRVGADHVVVERAVREAVLLTRWDAPENGCVAVASINREVQARAAAPDEREYLQLRAGTPVLALHLTSYTASDAAVRVERYTIPGTEYLVDLGDVPA